MIGWDLQISVNPECIIQVFQSSRNSHTHSDLLHEANHVYHDWMFQWALWLHKVDRGMVELNVAATYLPRRGACSRTSITFHPSTYVPSTLHCKHPILHPTINPSNYPLTKLHIHPTKLSINSSLFANRMNIHSAWRMRQKNHGVVDVDSFDIAIQTCIEHTNPNGINTC